MKNYLYTFLGLEYNLADWSSTNLMRVYPLQPKTGKEQLERMSGICYDIFVMDNFQAKGS